MIAIVAYNAGNIQSVQFALQRLGVEATVTADHQELQCAEKVIFPGVGEASTTMRYLQNNGIDQIIKKLTQPVLGICLGMQLMCSHSEEGNVDCLGIFEENIKQFSPSNGKVPHMGWNNIYNLESRLFTDIKEDSDVYFVHSYYAEKGPHCISTTDYGLPYASAMQKDNFYAVQFHPEKSSEVGSKILENFMKL